MNIQEIMVLAVIASAVVYVASMVYKRSRSFTSKGSCDNDCGCSAKTSEPNTVV